MKKLIFILVLLIANISLFCGNLFISQLNNQSLIEKEYLVEKINTSYDDIDIQQVNLKKETLKSSIYLKELKRIQLQPVQ